MKLDFFKQKDALKSVFLVLGIITGFVFIVAFSSLYVSDAIQNNNACGCVIPIPFMILILSSLGLFVGSFSYYFLVSKHVREQRMRRHDVEQTLQFLEPDERRLVSTLIKSRSGLKQSDIERQIGFHKVKVHRIVSRLVSRGVVEKSARGKVQNVRLKKAFLDIFR